MQRYVFYAEAKCRAGIKNVKRETKGQRIFPVGNTIC